MNKMKTLTIAGLLGSSLLLTGCGGGGGGGSSVTVNGVTVSDARGSITYEAPTNFSNGVTTASVDYDVFGGITVNGERHLFNDDGWTRVNADGTFTDSDGTSGTWERQNDGTFDFTFTLLGQNITTHAKPGSIETYTQGVNVDGQVLQVETTVDATKIIDFDRVESFSGTSAFLITNVATGTPSTQRSFTRADNIADSRIREEAKAAHSQGWTGLGATITRKGESVQDTRAINIAPEALRDSDIGIPNTYEVTSNTRGGFYNTNYADRAGTSALVLHKFDTLNAGQAGSIVRQTMDGNNVSITKALSPVGNLH